MISEQMASRKRRVDVSDAWYPGAGLQSKDFEKALQEWTISDEDTQRSKKRQVSKFFTRTSLLFQDLEVICFGYDSVLAAAEDRAVRAKFAKF